jgi:hypothetical protein
MLVGSWHCWKNALSNATFVLPSTPLRADVKRQLAPVLHILEMCRVFK